MRSVRAEMNSQLMAIRNLTRLEPFKKGNLVDVSQLKIFLSETIYGKTFDGIEGRIMTSEDDFIQDREEVFRDVARDIDFEDNIVIPSFCQENSIAPPHYHMEHEGIYVARGEVYDIVKRRYYSEGEWMHFSPMVLHHLFFTKETACIAVIAHR